MDREFIKNVGFKYCLNNRSLIVQLISLTKENSPLSNSQIEVFIKETSTYFDSIKNKDNLQELFGELDFIKLDSTEYQKPFYKFIHKETYDKYINKGKFQLGSLQYYREIEKNESRDEREGFSNLIIKSGNRQILTSVISGFNKYIFCGTHSLEQQESMAKKFGGYVMKIDNIHSFAEKVLKAIGADEWQINKVYYTDYKAYSAEVQPINISGVSPDLSDELFNILYQLSESPSVFSKPTRFKDEQELRLAFTMRKDVKTTFNFDNLGLLDYIEIIK